MTILTTSPQARPGPDHTPAVRSSRASSVAGGTVAVIAVGLIFEAGTAATGGPLGVRLLLVGLLLPLLAAGAQVLRLLGQASEAVVGAGDAGAQTCGTDLLLAGLETRDLWAARARLWAVGTSAGFLAWSLAVHLLG
ncbi:MAG: hypothetical protein ABIS86_10625 [Streptosporangiaceae bacterium]